MKKMRKITSTVVLLFLFFSIHGCGDNPAENEQAEGTETEGKENSKQAAKLTNSDCTDPDLSKVLAGVEFMLCDGSIGKGTMDLTDLTAENIKSGVSINGVTGSYAGNQVLTCDSDGQSDCLVDGINYKAAKLSEFSAADIKSGSTIAGVSGSYTGSYSTCTSNGETGCIATATYQAGDLSNLSAGNIKSGINIAGITGDYPSATYPLSGASGAVNDLGTFAYNIELSNDATHEFWNSAGERKTIDGSSSFTNSNIANNVTFLGFSGTFAPDCSSNLQQNCRVIGNYWSTKADNLSAGNIKNGVVIAGITGNYPSVSNPLTGSSGTADLDSASFDAQIKASTAFEWWDSTGSRHTGTGDDDITAANIKKDVVIFGATGSLDVSAPSALDLRYGVSHNGVTGEIQTRCVEMKQIFQHLIMIPHQQYRDWITMTPIWMPVAC